MLIPVTVMPFIFKMLSDVPEGTPLSASGTSALVTLLVIAGLALKARGKLRLWAPVVGVATGSVVAGFYGIYDAKLIAEAAWVGLPTEGWPGLDLSFGPTFWALLPAFVFVTLVGAIETIGDAVAIQRVSHRRTQAVDFRSVQGAVAADGLGNLLSGVAGTVAEHHLFEQRIGDRAHRSRGPPGRHCGGRRVHGDGATAQGARRCCWPFRGRSRPPTSQSCWRCCS